MKWIHRATGRLCVELAPEDGVDRTWLNCVSPIPLSDSMAMALFAGNAPDIEVLVMDTPLDAYHGVCYRALSSNSCVNIGTGKNVHLGTLNSWPANDAFVEIASLPDAGVEPFGWQPYSTFGCQPYGETLENGWTRFNAREVVGSDVQCWLMLGNTWKITQFWLSQANHIFESCHITANLEDYGLVQEVFFKVTISTTKGVPAGFLLLCPTEDFRIDKSAVGWPARPAYWSFDPLGTHPLSMEEANKAGFPKLQFTTIVRRMSWDSSVYAGLSKFHQAKGFDPYSQDVARHLDLPLYQPSGYVDPLFAHVVQEEDNSQDEDGSESQMDVDYEAVENQDAQDFSDMEID
ncbi:hypothetical protein C8R47DRAFT_214418 [Mycena vitilis]|nr:hypothetical protein C8R47DRAFT_214418 [Mycena vitilis]